jgi:murein DD-endopeptidase MepM/ murein hydrolase activator NlpD
LSCADFSVYRSNPVKLHLLAITAASVVNTAYAQCLSETTLSDPIRNRPASSQAFAAYLGVYNGVTFNGYHPGVDIPVAPGTPVFAPASGRVERARNISAGIGGILIVRHSGALRVPAKSTGTYRHQETTENSLQSVFVHVTPAVSEGACVARGQIIAYVTDITAYPDHLHWELGTGNQARSPSGSIFGRSSNVNSLGYYLNAQTMVDDGARDPLAVINIAPTAPAQSPEQIADALLRKCVSSTGLRPYVLGSNGAAYNSGNYRIQPTRGSLAAIAVPLNQSTAVLHYFWNGWGTVDISICN